MFDLADNPFTILGVTPRSTKSEIYEAVEEEMLDADGVEGERRLNVARQALIAPNERLRAELGYLLEMRPADARRVIGGRSGDDWLQVANGTEGIARTNALVQAVLAARTPGDGTEPFQRLFEAWEGIDEREIAGRINEARAIAGVADAGLPDIRRGLSELRNYHASRTLEQLDAQTRLSQVLCRLLRDTLIPARRMGERFPAAVIAAYQRKMGGAMASFSDRALAALDSYVSDASTQSFDEFRHQLTAWDELAQPLQLASEARGIDDAHSKELYDRIRRSALDLANDEDRHDDALRITDLSAEIFAELPWAVEAIRDDARKLKEILTDKARNRFLAPLADAVAQARDALAWTSEQLQVHGFGAGAPDLIGEIWRGYVAILDRAVDIEVRDLGARMVRSLSIELVNERSDALEAQMLTSQLLADRDWFSADLQNQLVADGQQVAINLSYQHLKTVMARADWKNARQICGELMAISPPSDTAELRQLERTIDRKLTSRTTGRVIWGSVAAVFIGAVILGGNDSSTSNPAYDYDTALEADPVEMTADEGLGGLASTGEEAIDGLQSLGTNDEEIAPPAYIYGALSLPQLRYCLRQEERVELARSMVAGYAQQTRFNAAVSDFNARCGNFRFDEGDMAIARSELAGMQSQLRSDAADIAGAGPAASPSPYGTPTADPSDWSYPGDTEVDDRTGSIPEASDPDNLYGESEEAYP